MQATQQNKDVYNRIARHFSSTRSFLWQDLKDPIFLQFVKPGDKILDIGCGNGRLYQLFQDISLSYTGVDQSSELLAVAREQFPNGNFVEGEMMQLPFPDHSFDLVYCIATFHHLVTTNDQLKALQEMKRVLKPGGKILMLNWNLHGIWAKEKVEKGDWRQENNVFFVPWKTGEGENLGERIYYGFTLEELENLYQKAGFTPQDQYYVRKSKKIDSDAGENIVSILTV